VEDNYRHKGLRNQLIRELERKGIQNQQILEAIGAVPRHLFLDKAFDEWAYKDNAFPIDCEQTISQPYTVAFQTNLLNIKPKEKILEIGLGSGYQACVLHQMGAKVYSIERHKKLHDKTAHFLISINYKLIRTFYGDGFLGLPRFAPFDKILVTAGAPEIPLELINQLKPEGIMVIPIGQGNDQIMYRITKLADGKLKKENFGHFRFVPMLPGAK
jgi:protein-L-isoaspartate(D-aspartate) O-methyltransferase